MVEPYAICDVDEVSRVHPRHLNAARIQVRNDNKYLSFENDK